MAFGLTCLVQGSVKKFFRMSIEAHTSFAMQLRGGIWALEGYAKMMQLCCMLFARNFSPKRRVEGTIVSNHFFLTCITARRPIIQVMDWVALVELMFVWAFLQKWGDG